MTRRYPTILIVLSLIVLQLAVMGCEDESDEDPIIGEIEYNGQTLTFRDGIIYDNGPEDGYYNYDFVIAEQVEDFQDESEFNSEYGIFLWAESNGESGFNSGSYIMPPDTTAGDNILFIAGYLTNITTNSSTNMPATSGSVDITRSGDTFTLTFNLTLQDGNTFTGTIEDEFEIVDLTSQSKADQTGKLPFGLR